MTSIHHIWLVTRDARMTSMRDSSRSNLGFLRMSVEVNPSYHPFLKEGSRINKVGVHHTVSLPIYVPHLAAQARVSTMPYRVWATLGPQESSSEPSQKRLHLVHKLYSSLTKYGAKTKDSAPSVSSLEYCQTLTPPPERLQATRGQQISPKHFT